MYYAVKIGRKPGIYSTWNECKEQVIGYSGAVYKKFSTESQALDYIGDNIQAEKNLKLEDTLNFDLEKFAIIAYVDGSYSLEDKTFSYGAVLFDGDIYEEASKRYYDENSEMRNVSGEIKGAMYAMSRSLELGKKKLYLHYDYAGIENWAMETWKANKEGTREYRDYYKSIKNKLEVVFVKVKAHSGVEYNEIADKLAKDAR